jgi:hypothetical protein
MSRRLLLVPVVLVLALASAGCRDMGPGGHGKVSTVLYSVTGSGDAQVRYAATGSSDLTPARSVHLPWEHEADVVDNSGIIYRVLVHAASLDGIHCSIEVNGVGVPSTVRRQGDVMECSFVK